MANIQQEIIVYFVEEINTNCIQQTFSSAESFPNFTWIIKFENTNKAAVAVHMIWPINIRVNDKRGSIQINGLSLNRKFSEKPNSEST